MQWKFAAHYPYFSRKLTGTSSNNWLLLQIISLDLFNFDEPLHIKPRLVNQITGQA